MASSCISTASRPDLVEICLGVDRDDPEAPGYVPVPAIVAPPGTTVSRTWNMLADISQGDILLMGNDDQIFETVGWDDVLRNVFAQYPDGIVCAWFNDDINGERHCAFPAVSRRWVDTVGYFAPTVGFKFFRNDTWIYDLARRVGRCHYIPEVSVRHEHHTNGGLQDATTMRNRSSGQGAHDQRVWVETVAVRERDSHKLRAAIESWEPVA